MKPIEVPVVESDELSSSGPPPVDLSGSRLLITGGIGTLAHTTAVRAAAAGAQIVLADLAPAPSGDRSTAWLERAAQVLASVAANGGSRPALYSADLADPAQADELVEEVLRGGDVDAVINFAGVHHPPFELWHGGARAHAAVFERVVSVNLSGAFNMTAAIAPAMARRGSGHVIHLCSNGSRAALYGSYAYNASKHGVEGLVKTAAAQLAPYGVRVNAVAPGTVITDLNRSLSFESDGTPRPRAKSILAHTPTKRFATAAGVAQTILAMLVPQPHFTGNVVFADDGYNVDGHSWPEGNEALYEGADAVDSLYRKIRNDLS